VFSGGITRLLGGLPARRAVIDNRAAPRSSVTWVTDPKNCSNLPPPSGTVAPLFSADPLPPFG
jgi:hypothetical protein